MNNSLLVQTEESAIRIDESNLNHHLWNNNGTWWIHYTIYPTPVTAERIRRSLKTRNLTEARHLRDQILEDILSQSNKLVDLPDLFGKEVYFLALKRSLS